MKKNWFYFLLALPLMLFTACGDDDSDDEAPKNADTVVINDNGTTSNGSVKNFHYLCTGNQEREEKRASEQI